MGRTTFGGTLGSGVGNQKRGNLNRGLLGTMVDQVDQIGRDGSKEGGGLPQRSDESTIAGVGQSAAMNRGLWTAPRVRFQEVSRTK